MHLARDGETSGDESLSSNFQLLPGAGEPSALGPKEMSPYCCLWLGLQERGDEGTRRQWVRWLSRAPFIMARPCGLALRGGLTQGPGLWTPAEALLWGLERGAGSCNPGIVVDDGFVCLPDSLVLEKECRITAAELWCSLLRPL